MSSSSSESTHHRTLEHSWSRPLVVSHPSIAPYPIIMTSFLLWQMCPHGYSLVTCFVDYPLCGAGLIPGYWCPCSVCFQTTGLQRIQTDVSIHLAELTLGIQTHFQEKWCRVGTLGFFALLVPLPPSRRAERPEWMEGAYLLPQVSQRMFRAQAPGLGEGVHSAAQG